jgi:hypothetical protein
MAQDREQRYPTAADMQADLSGGARVQRSKGAGEMAAVSLDKRCPDCQAVNRPAARFCRRCGRSFVGVLLARLRILQPLDVSWEMPIRSETMLIGRRSEPEALVPDLDLAFYDPNAYVSRRHATITRNGRRYEITDLGSDNGTFVNDARLPAHKARVLRNGDRIRVGRIVLQFAVNP